MTLARPHRMSFPQAFLVTALVAGALSAAPPARAATVWTVTSVSDAGGSCTPTSCTLRAAIAAVNASAGGDTIVFAIQPAGRYRIAVGTQLPDITGSDVVLDATSQPGGGTYPIWLDDADDGDLESGLVVRGSNVTITGFAITRFDQFGIYLLNTSGAVIQGNLIGTRDGHTDDGNASDGVHAQRGSGHLIGGSSPSQRNVISGGSNDGVELEDTSDSVVVGNYVGTTADGLGRLPNSGSGIEMNGDSLRNRVGGTTPGERNVVSGNNGIGVQILGSMRPDGTCETPADNVVLGNYLGPDVNGRRMTPYGNSGEGAQISTCATRNTIGGTTAQARNVISGNRADGVELDASGGPGGLAGVCGNVVQGNYIGTDPTGTIQVQNVDDGIGIDNGACETLVGGSTPGAGNLISGNFNDGIDINRRGTDRNEIRGNVIGLSADGNTVLRNTQHGVNIRLKAQANLVIANVISANVRSGVALEGFQTEGNVVQDNLIGVSTSGGAIRGNLEYGIWIVDGPKFNTIQGNTIRGSKLDGVAVEKVTTSDFSTVGNTITANAMSSNDGLGIDLLPTDGVNPIDGRTTTAVGNRGVDAPVIEQATDVSVKGTGVPGSEIEVFRAASGAGETTGEGSVFLGAVRADASGTWCLNGITTGAGAVTATATSSGSTSEFAANVAVAGTADVCAAPPPPPAGELFRDDFTGSDGSVPPNWEIRRSASGTGAGATIRSNAFAFDVVLSPEQTTNQWVQARETALQPSWSPAAVSFTWQMQTHANDDQAASFVLSPLVRTGNVLTGTDYLRVRVQNGRAALVVAAGGTNTTIWSGAISVTGELTELQLRIDLTHVELLAGPSATRASLSGRVAHHLTWTQAHPYFHASTILQTPFHTVFDTFVIANT